MKSSKSSFYTAAAKAASCGPVLRASVELAALVNEYRHGDRHEAAFRANLIAESALAAGWPEVAYTAGTLTKKLTSVSEFTVSEAEVLAKLAATIREQIRGFAADMGLNLARIDLAKRK